jgi:hypothetical protein
MRESKGNIRDIVEDFSGPNATVVYLSDENPNALAEKYNSILVGKQIIGAYSMGKLHFLAIYLAGKIKLTKRGK